MMYHAIMCLLYLYILGNIGRSNAFLVADLPFGSYLTEADALHNSARLLKEGGVDAVKLEVKSHMIYFTHIGTHIHTNSNMYIIIIHPCSVLCLAICSLCSWSLYAVCMWVGCIGLCRVVNGWQITCVQWWMPAWLWSVTWASHLKPSLL